MKIQALALVPPTGAQKAPKVTPELLASSLAKYSRSNKGITSILAEIDWNNPDSAVDRIFKFVDYGHASIAGLTGSIPITIDGCSMFLAYKLFEIIPLCDGQESSTRYIKMNDSSILAPEVLGIPDALREEWGSFMKLAFEVYQETYQELDKLATEQPERIQYPEGVNEKVKKRIRKNYALDRARYFIPWAIKTNVAIVATARVWADTIRQLAATPLLEAQRCAELLRVELGKFVPRLIKHSYKEEASVVQIKHEWEYARNYIKQHGVSTKTVPDEVFVAVEEGKVPFLPPTQSIAESFLGKQNRYSRTGERMRRMFVRFAWNNISLAELRDLNRHRSGFRFSPLVPVGFYLPEKVTHPKKVPLLEKMRSIIQKLAQTDEYYPHVYGMLLGVQTPFEHSTHADKFIYEVELRTGMGAHFRYSEHLTKACRKFLERVPEAAPYIEIGKAEPE